MTGRLLSIQIPLWVDEELRFIPDVGFGALNSTVDDATIHDFCKQAIGSPHLMQDFCRNLCKSTKIIDETDGRVVMLSTAERSEVYADVAETIGRPIFEKLARGPRQRSDRLQRELKDGTTVDIYGLVLNALACIRPGLITIEYEELRAAIRDVVDQPPQLHEVVRVLKHMSGIASSDESSTPVLDFEEEEKVLHVTDPFFAFYLRWGDLGQ